MKLKIAHQLHNRRLKASEYTLREIKRFEEGWSQHEAELKQYNLNQAKLKDWDVRTKEG